MNWKFLAVPLAVPAVFLISSSALTGCEVCTGEDCPDFGGGGLGGQDTGGDTGGSGGGATSGGTGGMGQGGMGGESLVIECTDTASGTAGSCEPSDAEDACQVCIESKCCAEQEACYAYEPEQACGWGSVLYDGTAMNEASCMLTCLDDLEEDPNHEFLGVQEDLDMCSAQCGAVECGESSTTEVTNDLAGCILGTHNDDDPDNDEIGCQVECGLL